MELRSAIHQMDVEHKVGMARLEGKVDAIQDTTGGTKKKVDGLVRWQTLIIGGTAVAGIVASALFGLYIKFGDRITIAPAPAATPITAPVPATPPLPVAKP
ncbi:hypothetical protein [Giesbergeria anulus]|nr:hypothetical protein [Giesbergeria anulus]